MLKRIDELGRIVLPKSFREEIGVKNNEDVEMVSKDNQIIIRKARCMPTLQSIEEAYRTLQLEKTGSEYDKGFEDALKFVLGKE